MSFDIGTFPAEGRHLLEASAGTGKTHTLMQLAIQMLGEHGIEPADLVLMTFTRASTRELRARLRGKLTEASSESTDAQIKRRLQTAVRRLDQVTILTIHGFALHILRELGPTVGIHPRPMNEETDGLLLDAALDVYRQLRAEEPPALVRATIGSAKQFVDHAKLVSNHASIWHPDGSIKPHLSEATAEFQERVQALVPTIEQLKQTQGAQPNTVEKYCQQVLEAALPNAIPKKAIDYFADKVEAEPLFQAWVNLTEATPTQVAFRAYALRQVEQVFQARLTMQGEMHPDQIIEDAARVASQIAPAHRPTHRVILVDEFQDTDRNQWLLLDQLYPDEAGRLMVMVGDPKQAIYRFRGADTRFYYQIRDALPEDHRWSLDTNFRSTDTVVKGLNQLYDARHPVGASLECQHISTGKKDLPPLTLDQQPLVGFQWCSSLNPQGVAELAATLITLGASGRLTIGERAVCAGDICVLVDSWKTAASIQQAGRALGVSFHSAEQRSVFADPLSREMVSLLDAIANPDDLGAVSSAATTQLIGLSLVGEGSVQQHPDFALLQQHVIHARTTWYREGPAAAVSALFSQYQTEARLPHDFDGLTGWMALAQALEVFGAEGKGLNPFEAARWWAHRATNHSQIGEHEKPRAPNRDGVVNVTTVHGAKGLQYRIVILGSTLKIKSADDKALAVRYCTDQGLALDFHATGRALANIDLESDAHRLAYVALTRAEHAVFLAEPGDTSALQALLAGRALEQLGPDHQCLAWPTAVSKITAQSLPTTEMPLLDRPHMASWFIRSYSSLVRHQADHDQPTRAEDEVDLLLEADPTAAQWHRIPGGTATGNFIHEVLEHAARHQTSPDIATYVDRNWPSHLDHADRAHIVQWVESIRQVTLPGGVTLAELSPEAVRPEPQFQLPFTDDLTLDGLLDSFRALSWWDDPLEGSQKPLKGQLTGYIDLVYAADGRYHLLDYKTNHLGHSDAHYTADAIAHTMRASHYQTQAAIYALALHRWLEQRLIGYDPVSHLGEVVYLFARGIDGPMQGIWRQPIEAEAIVEIASRCLRA